MYDALSEKHGSISDGQRSLRDLLLGKNSDIDNDDARNLAAHLLLYVDEVSTCWEILVAWLRDRFDADRVDGGFISTQEQFYAPTAEALRSTREVPSVLSLRFNMWDVALRSIFTEKHSLVYENFNAGNGLSAHNRAAIMIAQPRSKMSIALHNEQGVSFGLICVDSLDANRHWDLAHRQLLEDLIHQVVNPIMSLATQLHNSQKSALDSLGRLTRAEREVATLVAEGLSYKEIARRLRKSTATVDHQLRSIRSKLGTVSTPRLIKMLNYDALGEAANITYCGPVPTERALPAEVRNN